MWLLTSARTWCPRSLDALVYTPVFCADLRFEFGGKNNSRLVHSIIKTMGHETTRTVISIRPRSSWGLEQSVFWDFNQSMTEDWRKCASLSPTLKQWPNPMIVKSAGCIKRVIEQDDKQLQSCDSYIPFWTPPKPVSVFHSADGTPKMISPRLEHPPRPATVQE